MAQNLSKLGSVYASALDSMHILDRARAVLAGANSNETTSGSGSCLRTATASGPPSSTLSGRLRGGNTDVMAHVTGFGCGLALGLVTGSVDVRVLGRSGQWLCAGLAVGLVAWAWALAGRS